MSNKISTNEDIVFPQYRMYKNSKSYFKISSLDYFEEKYFIGKKILLNRIQASQYPEKIFIRDLLFNYHDMAIEITEGEYEKVI